MKQLSYNSISPQRLRAAAWLGLIVLAYPRWEQPGGLWLTPLSLLSGLVTALVLWVVFMSVTNIKSSETPLVQPTSAWFYALLGVAMAAIWSVKMLALGLAGGAWLLAALGLVAVLYRTRTAEAGSTEPV